jgi:hypothetical protein
MIKHHNYFKVHLPKEYSNSEDLGEIIMEEFHLSFGGKATPNYETKNPKEDEFEISLYPSIPYLSKKLNHTEQEQFQSINNYLDHAFVDFLCRFSPLHKSITFVEYHLHFFAGDEKDFINHIKYQVLAIIRKRKMSKKYNCDYESLGQIIEDWVEMKKDKKNSSVENNIGKAKNVIINNNSKVKSQGNKLSEKPVKDYFAKIGLWIAVLGIIISIIVGWEEILEFFKT